MYVEGPSEVGGARRWCNTPDASPGPVRVLPDGCMDLIWRDGALVVAGPDTSAHVFGPSVDPVVGLRFAPGHLPGVLGLPASAVVDERVPVAELLAGTRACEHVIVAEDRLGVGSGRPGAVLDELALALGARRRRSGFVERVADLAAGGHGVAAIADATGYSPRQLHRRCLEAFGYGPKVLGRVLRLQRALAIVGRGTSSLADVAARAGYADQPHLSREVRSLAGTSLTRLLDR